MLFEIINFSDTYTMRASSFRVAVVATLMLGEGKLGLVEIDGERVTKMPLMLSGINGAWFDEQFGATVEDVMADVVTTVDDVVAALESVAITAANEEARFGYEAKLAAVPEAERLTWREKRHDKKRTSTCDIGTAAWALARELCTACPQNLDGAQ